MRGAFGVVVVFVLHGAEFGVVVQAGDVVLDGFERREVFVACRRGFARLCPAGDAVGGFDEMVAFVIYQQDVQSAAGRQVADGMTAVGA